MNEDLTFFSCFNDKTQKQGGMSEGLLFFKCFKGQCHLSVIYSLYVDLKAHGGLYLVCLTLYVQV